jgi:hypothetical protein
LNEHKTIDKPKSSNNDSLTKNRTKSADPRKNLKSATTRMKKLNKKNQEEKENAVKENLEGKDKLNNENNNALKSDFAGEIETVPIIMKEKKEDSKNNSELKKKSAVKVVKSGKSSMKPNV